MIAAGLADGNIAVYDLTCKTRAPRLMSKVLPEKQKMITMLAMSRHHAKFTVNSVNSSQTRVNTMSQCGMSGG